MSPNTIRKITEDHVSALDGTGFQDLCDRLNFKLYADDGQYEATRAAGRGGDMKCDGYCPQERIFFAVHATRGESTSATKTKIRTDLEGCLSKQKNIAVWRYMTNDTLNGEVQVFVDELRANHPEVRIEVWDHKIIANHIADLPLTDVETVLDMHFGSPTSTDLPVLDVSGVGYTGGSQGHFTPIKVKNRGRSDAVDCRISIVGDGYEWIGDTYLNRRDLEPNQETHEIRFPLSDEVVFREIVANLQVVMEYRDVLGNKYISTRSLLQELVNSKEFYILKRGDNFGAPNLVT